MIRAQCFGCHGRAQVRTTDADVDNIGKCITPAAGDFADAQVFGELPHGGKYSIYIRHYVFAIDKNRAICPVSKRGVKRRALLCGVDATAAEKCVALSHQGGSVSKVYQESDSLIVNSTFRPVDKQISETGGVPGKTVRLLSIGLAHILWCAGATMLKKPVDNLVTPLLIHTAIHLWRMASTSFAVGKSAPRRLQVMEEAVMAYCNARSKLFIERAPTAPTLSSPAEASLARNAA